MVQPIDYLGMIYQPDISANAEGLALALARRRQMKDEAEMKAADEEKALAMSRQYAADVENAFSDGSAEAFARLAVKYPQQREALGDAFDLLDDEGKETEFGAAAEIYNAMENNPSVALDLMNRRIAAAENSGEDAADLKAIRDLYESDNDSGRKYTAFLLSSIDADRWSKIAGESRERSLEGLNRKSLQASTSKAEAEARKAASEAKMAESQELASIYSSGMNIEPFMDDPQTSKLNRKIAAMTVARDKATDGAKQAEIDQKIEAAKLEREQKLRDQRIEVEAATAGIENSIGTIDDLLNNPALDVVIGPIEGITGVGEAINIATPWEISMKDRADAVALIETVKSQQFLDNLLDVKARGAAFGALSEKEGAKLENAVRSLGRRQSERQFRENLNIMKSLLEKSKVGIRNKYGEFRIPKAESGEPSQDQEGVVEDEFSGFEIGEMRAR